MRATPIHLVVFSSFLLLLLGCPNTAEQGVSVDQLRNALLGDWAMRDDPTAEELWQFRDDGTYKMVMGEYEDFGTWELKERVLMLDNKQSESDEIFITSDKLEWGTYTFNRIGKASVTPSKPKVVSSDPATIIGTWKLQRQGEESTYEFKSNNTYEVVLGKGGDALEYEGTWEIKDGNMVLDGHEESSSSFELKNDRLYWREDEYARVGQAVAPTSDNLYQQLVGTWITKELGPEIRFTFSSDGTFTSYDGRYETKGKWELSDNELILDGYKGSASAIAISGSRLTWDDVRYTKQ
ncbi:MAG: hypothetical protein AAF798_15820 [Bacteroidota bacterium]